MSMAPTTIYHGITDEVLGALVLADIEREIEYGRGKVLAKYFELLEGVGHHPNKQERELLKRKDWQ